MAKGDIVERQAGAFGTIGSRRFQVQAGAAASINAGEPVAKALGAQYVTAMATSKPVVATDFLAGIAASTSTDTASADGVVDVFPIVAGQVWLITPKTATAWDTQAEYNALIGDRVTIDLTGGSYTLNATDGATNGCVIENLNIIEVPGKVAFAFRLALAYTA
jgi:hypothetical protein